MMTLRFQGTVGGQFLEQLIIVFPVV